MPKRYRYDLAAFGWIGNDAEVDLALDEVFVDLIRAQVLQVHVDGRIIAQELGQVGRQLVQTDAVHRADANRAGDHRADFAESILQFQESAHDFLARGVEDLPGRGRFDSGASAFYQSAVILLFEAADLLADRRLGYEIL